MRKKIALTIGIIIALVACSTIPSSNKSTAEIKDDKLKTYSANLKIGEVKPSTDLNSKQNKVNCDNLQTREELESCLLKSLNELDTKLTEELRTARENLQKYYTNNDLVNLNSTQKIWLSYRNSNCEAEKDLYGLGTDSVQANFNCKIALTEERIKEIHRIYGDK